MPQTVWVSWSLLVGVQVTVQGSENQLQTEGLDPQGPPVEQPSRMRKKCYCSQRNLGSICCSLFRLQLTSHTRPIRNPFATFSRKNCERYIFLKKCVCSSLLLTMFPCVAAYVLCGYTTDGVSLSVMAFHFFTSFVR